MASLAKNTAAPAAHQLTTGPLITVALDTEGVAYELHLPYLRVATPSGYILITSRDCNQPYEGGRDFYDIPRARLLGFSATWYEDTDNEDASVHVVYDGTTATLRPAADAEACAAAVAEELRPALRTTSFLLGDAELRPQVCSQCHRGNYRPIREGCNVYACTAECGHEAHGRDFDLLEDGERLELHQGLLHVAALLDAPF